MQKLIFEGESERIDTWLTKQFSYSRNFFHHILERKGILVNGKVAKKSLKLKSWDQILIDELERYLSPIILEEAPKLDIPILKETADYLIINKPKWVLSHPNSIWDVWEPSVVGFLYHHYKELPSIGSFIRAGLLHRLDKDTTGLIICAKDDETHLKLIDMFSKREISKKYLAICNGSFSKESGFIDKPIGRDEKDRKKMSVKSKSGKEALTEYNILTSNLKYSLVDVTLHTGRTHQIRVHFSSINHPIVGDDTYGNKNEKIKANGQMLHSYYLEFSHPITKENLSFTVLPDEYFFSIFA